MLTKLRKRSRRALAAVGVLGMVATVLFTVSVPQAQAQSADFSCEVTAAGADATLRFTGTEVGTTANLRDGDGWVATVTGQSSYTVVGGAAASYIVKLNRLRQTVSCQPPSPPVAADFTCTVTVAGDDARLGFSGSDIGTAANLRDGDGWVATVTGQSSYAVVGGAAASYLVKLNSLRQTVSCEAPVEPPPPEADFSCKVNELRNDAFIEFSGGDVGTAANLRDADGWVATVTGQTSYAAIGGAGQAYSVRLNALNNDVDCEVAPRDCSLNAKLVPECPGVLLGSSSEYSTRQGFPLNRYEDFKQNEREIGRLYDIYHFFLRPQDWARVANNGVLFNSQVAELAEDRVLFYNWKSPTGKVGDWQEILNGDHDAVIDATGDRYAEFGEPIFLTFFHEPDAKIKKSVTSLSERLRLSAQYAETFRYIHDRFDARGASNVLWVFNPTGFLGDDRPAMYEVMYPGDDVIDWYAWNQYNWYGCKGSTRWRTPAQTLDPMYTWLTEDGPGRPGLTVPLMIGEFSTQENDGNAGTTQTKGEWFAEYPEALMGFPRIKAVMMFDTEGWTRVNDQPVQAFCDWSTSQSSESQAGWTSATNHPYLDVLGRGIG